MVMRGCGLNLPYFRSIINNICIVHSSSVRSVVQVKEYAPGCSVYMIAKSMETPKRSHSAGPHPSRVGWENIWQQQKQVARGT